METIDLSFVRLTNRNMSDLECSICVDTVNPGLFGTPDTIRLPCGHWYHKECIHQWFQHKGIDLCPYCRSSATDCYAEEKLAFESYLYKLGHQHRRLPSDYATLYNQYFARPPPWMYQSDYSMKITFQCVSILPKEKVIALIQDRMENLIQRNEFALDGGTLLFTP